MENKEEVLAPVVHEEASLTLVDELNRNSKELYCSLPADTVEDKKAIFKVLGSADYKVADTLGTTINLRNVLVQKYEKVNQETGEVETKYRTILIDENGTTYASASKGLFTSCKRLFALMGLPENWTEPLPIKVEEVKTTQGFKTYEIKLV